MRRAGPLYSVERGLQNQEELRKIQAEYRVHKGDAVQVLHRN
jgi:hypothetical protein